jgi:NTE family protein
MGLEVASKPTELAGGTVEPAEFMVVSDAGYPAQAKFRESGLPAVSEAFLLYRVDEIARDQVAALRRRMLVSQFQHGSGPSGVLLVLGSSIAKVPSGVQKRYAEAVGSSSLIPPDLVALIHCTRTSLDAFSAVECEALMYHGYTLADCVLWAYEGMHPPSYRAPHPGKWRITFTPTKVREWAVGLRRGAGATRS